MQQRTRSRRARADAPAFRSGWLRFVLALCASFVAVGHLAAVTHMVFVAHARCADHGELVHVAASPRAAAPQGRSRAAASLTAGDASTSDEHDHCLLGAPRPSHAGVAEAAHRIVPHDDPEVTAPLPSAPRARAKVPPPPPIALLLLSPKSSPPA